MSELANQVQARKARLQRFAEAAAQYNAKCAVQADTEQCRMVLKQMLIAHSEPPPVITRREYEPKDQPSAYIPMAKRILRAVAAEFGMNIDRIIGDRRQAKYCLPRYVAIGLMIDLTRMSLPAIGRQLGGRDHTTIINGRQRIRVLLQSEAFRNRFEQIKAGLVA